MQDAAMSLAVLMSIALPLGAFFLWKRGGYGKQVALMLVLAAVMAANVAIWVVPTKDGAVLGQQKPQ